ncbi:hypothetical protein LTR66_015461 [Elasticomyces elasticus]|nr:hypothetical protein LTR66_015461 [Elasticomyces elasticus]
MSSPKHAPRRFTHNPEPGPDTGVFDLSEARPGPPDAQLPDAGGSRLIALPKRRYTRPPRIATGLKAIDLSCARDTVSVACSAEDISATHFRPTIHANSDAWPPRAGSPATDCINWAQMTWLETKADAQDCQIGLVALPERSEGEDWDYFWTAKRAVRFERAFAEPPSVLCWLNSVQFYSDGDPEEAHSYTINAWASEITAEGCEIHMDGKRGSKFANGTTCYIAWPKHKPHVASGSFSTGDADHHTSDGSMTHGHITFPPSTFARAPTVLVCLRQFDVRAGDGGGGEGGGGGGGGGGEGGGGEGLRVRVDRDNVDRDGFDWHLGTWGHGGSGRMVSARATWLAFDFA